jgi:hypothetical protein
MLIAYFEMTGYLVPMLSRVLYVAHTGQKWQRRVRDKSLKQIGRIVSANPAEGECYCLRVFLNHVAGATFFEDLRTVDGVILLTFREATERRGLIEADNTLDNTIYIFDILVAASALSYMLHDVSYFFVPFLPRHCIPSCYLSLSLLR